MKEVKAWAVVDKKTNEVSHLWYLEIYPTRSDARSQCDRCEKVVRVIIKEYK
jgi:hypothetical protein